MKIRAIEAFDLSVAFVTPYRLSRVYGTLTHNRAVVVKVTTEGGLVGWGEADPLPPFTEESAGGVVAALEGYLGPALLGLDAAAIGRANAVMDAAMSGNLAAKGALDMALHDIVGKSLGVPVHRLLGGALVDGIDIMWPLGSGSPDDDIRVVEAKRPEGYRTFMAKMGTQDIATEIRRVKTLTERYHPDVRFVADANQGWEVGDALRFAAGANAYPLALIEQPVAHWNHRGLKRVRDASVAPVSADESLMSITEAGALVRDEVVDVFSIKVSKNGGIAAGRKIAAVAEAAGVKCLMNSMLEFGISQAASLQLGCTLGNLLGVGHAYGSTLRLTDDMTDFSDLVVDGVARVPDRPGLGVAVDEDKLARLCTNRLRIGGSAATEGAAA